MPPFHTCKLIRVFYISTERRKQSIKNGKESDGEPPCSYACAYLWSYGHGHEISFNHEDEEWEGQRGGHRHWFLLQRSRLLVKTEAGELRVVRSVGNKIVHRPINVGYLTLEPNSLFLPQYLDSTLILFVSFFLDIYSCSNVNIVFVSKFTTFLESKSCLCGVAS